uniref:CRAL-TRIO domain-containing protein n=1 Tax=Hemiselmis tepida TaxID=464990 RepID=A0A7S0VUD6_9CRYP|mmetsp:Transcript_28551/g.72301  ORF Transcript_28551/g.72301 Transcript_28551/m.72301 type:complete len:283 (+) Transcript_28551:89-937(+)
MADAAHDASFDRATSSGSAEKFDKCCDGLSDWVSGLELQEVNRGFCGDRRNLMRFAVARRGNLEGARKQLEKCLRWREENLPADPLRLGCEACEADRHTHCFFSLGLDIQGRNVVYASAPRAKMNGARDAVLHMARTLELGWSHAHVAPQWVWVIDFTGFRMHDAMQVKTSVAVMSTFGDVMPERLGGVILVNPPTILSIILTAIKPFVDDRTMSKVVRVKIRPGEDLSQHPHPSLATLRPQQQGWLEKALTYKPLPGQLPPIGALDTKGLHFATGAPVQEL